MPVFLIIVGMVLMMAAINSQIGALGSLAKRDLFGSGASGDYGFIIWAAAVIAIGAVLRAIDLPDAGRFLVALVIVAYLLGHAGIPTQILQELKGSSDAGASSGSAGGPPAPAAPAAPASPPFATGGGF